MTEQEAIVTETKSASVQKLREIEHWLMLVWLVVTGLIVFGLIICWNEGLIDALIAGDKSRISLIIALLYCAGTVHCAGRGAFLSTELNVVARFLTAAARDPAAAIKLNSNGVGLGQERISSATLLGEHIVNVCRAQGAADEASERATLVEVLAAKVKGPHDLGWFVVDVLLKLGLIGTIVGFILMLSSVANTASLDVNTMQKVLKQMSAGMGTALFTTLTGLSGSILLGMQYLLLDKGADSLIEQVVEFSETEHPRFPTD